MTNTDSNSHLVHLQQELLWGDMDAFGHINNTIYFRYFEDIRLKYFYQVGIMEYMQQHNIGPILANTECHFKLPLKFPDSITLSTKIHDMQGKRLTMDYSIYSKKHNKVAAVGSGLIIFYDYDNQQSCEIPEQIKRSIEKVESLKD